MKSLLSLIVYNNLDDRIFNIIENIKEKKQLAKLSVSAIENLDNLIPADFFNGVPAFIRNSIKKVYIKNINN